MRRAGHIRTSPALADLGTPALGPTSRIPEAGRAGGDVVTSAGAIDVHMTTSAFCVLHSAARHTFEALSGRGPTAAKHRARHHRVLGGTVAAYLAEGARHPGA
ncbi:hypothetical protein [Streptomyces sp. Wb2n-11]|uniref:hypothetical protein n=1 Tax=Streptomyces sp. Wb2n-11 TaxID=1030533 RepID=UPI0021004921|nr:hypothetical protein [Streptomyces sp. Wb2n-11]